MSKWIVIAAVILGQSFFGNNLLGSNITPAQKKKLLYRDAVYEMEIKTVQLYPYSGRPNDVLLPAVAPLHDNNLVLEFDDLVQAPERYQVKLIHCNHDWTPSRLKNLDFLYDYNEFNIDQYELSVDTKLSYVHYKFKVPRVKVQGNYLLVAYRGSDESDIILSKRFIIFSNQVAINLTSSLTGLTSMDRKKQQLDFKILYPDYPIENPTQNIKVVIRQNQRWDNAITGLHPNFIRENVQELEYRFFNFENAFDGGNEFRFFDMRSLRHPGQNVQRIDLNTRPSTVMLQTDLPRIYQPYTQYNDLEGNFFIANADTGNGAVQGDYVTVRFNLKAKKIGGDVYVIGEMNNWNLTNKMAYQESSETYTGEMILKQGYYDYKYFVKSDTINPNYLEGNHFETENEYEVLVYYRPPSGRADLIIGYAFFEMNPVR